MSREVSPEEIAQLEELAKKATPGPWATSEDMDEIWGGISGSQAPSPSLSADALRRLLPNPPQRVVPKVMQ